MVSFFSTFALILPMLLMIALGFVFRRLQIFSGEFVRCCNKFVYNFCVPCMMYLQILSMDTSGGSPSRFFFCLLGSLTVILLAAAAAAKWVFRTGAQRGAMIHILTRSNYIILALPLINELYGKVGGQTIAITFPVMLPLFNVLSIIILQLFESAEAKVSQRKPVADTLKMLIKNPIILGVLAGFIAYLTHLQLPSLLDNIVRQFNSIAMPLLLLCLGAQFVGMQLKGRLWQPITLCLIKQLCNPCAVVFLGTLLHLSQVELVALYLMFASPLPLGACIMAGQMGSDVDLTASSVVISTVFAPISMLLGVTLIRALGLG